MKYTELYRGWFQSACRMNPLPKNTFKTYTRKTGVFSSDPSLKAGTVFLRNRLAQTLFMWGTKLARYTENIHYSPTE